MRQKTIIYFTAILIIVSSVLSFSSLNAAPEVNQAAVNYLKTKSDNAWKTMALVAAGESNLSSAHLKNVNSENAIDYCAPTLALTALGQDPRTEPGQDYIAKLKFFWDGTQLGNGSTLNDDIFGLLALISSGEPTTDPVITGLKTYLLSKQNTDGGWGLFSQGSSDTNMTSMAIMALLETGLTSEDAVMTKAINYLKSAQNDDAGFPYDPQSPASTDSDSSSDAWVISALYKLGQDPETSWTKNGANPISHLKSLQAPEGYFRSQAGANKDNFSPVATAYALIALAGQSYPLNKITPTSSETFSLRLEGKDKTICQGEFNGPTALDLVKNAAATCGFTYEIEATALGPYLKKINDEAAQGLSGWLYFINYESPTIGAGDYILKSNDEVLWYYGDWGWFPLKIAAEPAEVPSGSSIVVTVSSYNQDIWSPLEGATVKLGSQDFATNASGQITLTLPDGYYHLYAQGAGYVRSNKITLKFGNPAAQTVDLEVNIQKGAGGNPAGGNPDNPPLLPQENKASFSIDVSDLNFGTLYPGQVSTQNLKLTNQSSDDLYITSNVTGADIFRINLYLDKKNWRDFGLNLLQNTSENTEVKLSIPADYKNFGSQTGAITFWGKVID